MPDIYQNNYPPGFQPNPNYFQGQGQPAPQGQMPPPPQQQMAPPYQGAPVQGQSQFGSFFNPNGNTGRNAATWMVNPAAGMAKGMANQFDDSTGWGKAGKFAANMMSGPAGPIRAISGLVQGNQGASGAMMMPPPMQPGDQQQESPVEQVQTQTQQSMYAPRSEYQYAKGGNLPSYANGGSRYNSGYGYNATGTGANSKAAGMSGVVAGVINPIAGLISGGASMLGRAGGEENPGVGQQATSWLQPWKRTAAHMDEAKNYDKGTKERRNAYLRAAGSFFGGSIGSSVIDARDANIRRKAGSMPAPEQQQNNIQQEQPINQGQQGPQYGGYSFGTYDPQGQAARSYGFTNGSYAMGGNLPRMEGGGNTDWGKVAEVGVELAPIIQGMMQANRDKKTNEGNKQDYMNMYPEMFGMSNFNPYAEAAKYGNMGQQKQPSYYSNYGVGPQGGHNPSDANKFYY